MSRTEKCNICKYKDIEKSNESWVVCMNISQDVLDFMDKKVDTCSEYKKEE